MKIVFLTISSKLPGWVDEVAGDYQKKLSFWIPTELKVLPAPSLDREAKDKKLKLESEKLSAFLKDDDFVLLCDERGKSLSSLEFAKKFESILNSGKKRIVVIIGGSYGVDATIKARANFTIGLSPFTLNHHMALAVTFEQIYRGMTILKGTQYHNG